MSLLTVDQRDLDREERAILGMFPERGHDLALKLGFTAEWREQEKDHAYRKGTAVVYFIGSRKDQYEAWMTAQEGKLHLVAHIYHESLTRALIDALNRDC